MTVTRQALVAGGGIGGLAAALACLRAGWEVRLFEQAAAFGEAGAGIQLGPNSVRVLRGWGLEEALARVAARPVRLRVRSARTGAELASLALDAMPARYGAPYLTVHRADLHGLLLEALQQHGGDADGCRLRLACRLTQFGQHRDAVTVQAASGPLVEGDILIGADGLWSPVRQWLLADGAPRRTGHLAYRALPAQAALPAALRSSEVTVWLGPRLHVVQYPVRGGEALNVVVLVEGPGPQEAQGWDHRADAAGLAAALAGVCAPLRDLAEACGGWRLWVLCDRPPLRRAEQMAQGRAALLGDAAHPMLPYLAQGAGMALEDANELERALRMDVLDAPEMLRRYALNRWQRNARVQARSQRNGLIFHADGPLRWARDAGLRLLGERLLDQRWLYAGPAWGRGLGSPLLL